MSQTEEDYQEILQDLLYGPPTIFSVMVLYTDGSTRLFTFSDEDSQVSYVEYLQEAGEELGMVSATLFESLLDADHIDYKELTRVH